MTYMDLLRSDLSLPTFYQLPSLVHPLFSIKFFPKFCIFVYL